MAMDPLGDLGFVLRRFAADDLPCDLPDLDMTWLSCHPCVATDGYWFLYN